MERKEEQPVDRRLLFERHWSTSNLSGRTIVPGIGGADRHRRGSPAMTDILQHWTNTPPAANNFLGNSMQLFSSWNENADLQPPQRRTSTSVGGASAIHDAARITDWDKVHRLCQSNPEWAMYAGRDGWTALHHACNRRCPFAQVVEALIRAYPDALLKEEEKGWLPLHYACRFKAPKEVVRLLLHMCPDKGRVAVAKRDRLGRTPLYYAVRYDAPAGVVGLLLQVDPSVVLEEDQNEDSPLALVWDSWAEKSEGIRTLSAYIQGDSLDETDDARAVRLQDKIKKDTKLHKRWKKANMLLKSAFGFPVDEGETDFDEADVSTNRVWRVVHATVAVKCHKTLFQLACALHPEQIQELDESDLRRPGDALATGSNSPRQTALHLAVSSNAGDERGKYVIQTLIECFPQAAQMADGIKGSLPLHRIVENECKQDWEEHVAIIYRAYPQAIQIEDNQGKLPLHRAAAAIKHCNRENEGVPPRSIVANLVRNFPEGASHVDHSGCFPFHYITMHAEVWDDDVEYIYNANQRSIQVRAGPFYDNRLPLHMAAASTDSRRSLLTKLVELHPRAASMSDRNGKLPLHLACEFGKEWKFGVNEIYQAFPEAVQRPEENPRCWLPLHMASGCAHTSVDLIKNLIKVYSDASGVPDTEGNYPLHLACKSGKHWQGGLQILFGAFPSAICSMNKKGMLPIHVAALRYASTVTDQGESNEAETGKLDILYNLIRADPATVASLDSSG